MKADRNKLELAMARACLLPSELAERAGMPRPTVSGVISMLDGMNVRPATLGKIARALGVDVEELLEVTHNEN